MVNKVIDELGENQPSNVAATNPTPSQINPLTISPISNVQEPKETDVYRRLGKTEWQIMKKVYNVLNSDKN